MTYKQFFISLIFLFFQYYNGFGQKKGAIKIPIQSDAYAEFVKKAENGELKLNYKAFRESYIKSKQFISTSAKKGEVEKLKKDMYNHMATADYKKVIKIAQSILSLDYTDMLAHKILSKSFLILGDSLNAKKYKIIEEGLIHSILTSSDGKSCATAWKIVQMEEEKFVLNYLEAKLINQSGQSDHGICDKMEIEIKGKKSICYFEITKVFESLKFLKDNK